MAGGCGAFTQPVSEVMASPHDEHARQVIERAFRVLPDADQLATAGASTHPDGTYPHLAEWASGARFRDIAGNDYLDWYMAGGPVVLGHQHPEVQAAAERQLALGANLSLRSPLEVDVAERLCAMVPSVEQVAFAKNGTDVTSGAVRLARAVTGRDVVLTSGYHGFADWSKGADDGCVGIPDAVRSLVHEFPCNDVSAARDLIRRHRGTVAAIVVEPIRYTRLDPDFLPGLRELADREGCLLVFDEVVTGFRVAPGGVQELTGVPADLVCLAKGLANGFPLAALGGPRRLMQHLPPTHFSMTYRRDALSLAAADAALSVYAEQDVVGHIAALGEQLRSGFAAANERVGLDWSLDGHPALLHMATPGRGRVTDRGAITLFVQCCQRAGVYIESYRLLPSLAHTEDDVVHTLEVMELAMRTVRTAFESGLEGHLDGPVGDHLETRPYRSTTPVPPGSGSSAPRRSRRALARASRLLTRPSSRSRA